MDKPSDIVIGAALLHETLQHLRGMSFDPNHAEVAETANLMISILPRRDGNAEGRFRVLVSVHVYGHRRVDWTRMKLRLLPTAGTGVASFAAAQFVTLNASGQITIGDLPLARYRIAAALDLPNVITSGADLPIAVGYLDSETDPARTDTSSLVAAVCGQSGDALRIWDVARSRCWGEIGGFDVKLAGVSPTPGAPSLIVHGTDGSLWLVDLVEKRRICLRTAGANGEALVTANSDGTRILIGNIEDGIAVIDNNGIEIDAQEMEAGNNK